MFKPWTEIKAFHNINSFYEYNKDIVNNQSKIDYKCKVKLHGTNAAVQCFSDKDPVAQSRASVITTEKDNCGFAKFVESNKEFFKNIAKTFGDVILFGEWAGQSIQSGVALSNIKKKIFAIFSAIRLDSSEEFISEPDVLSGFENKDINIYVLPWYKQVSIDLSSSSEDKQKILDTINTWVSDVEKVDPFVKENFGIDGLGEGLVFYPTSKEHLSYNDFCNLCFKAKGEAHKNIKNSAPAQVNASKVAGVDEFVDLVLTEARLQQGANAIGLGFQIQSTGKFIDWILKDVEKETKDELSASNLTFDIVKKPLSQKAKNWYIEKSKRI